jgi:hypothetical protein
MLTVVDLHQEEELSSSNMGKVAGGDSKTSPNPPPPPPLPSMFLSSPLGLVLAIA